MWHAYKRSSALWRVWMAPLSLRRAPAPHVMLMKPTNTWKCTRKDISTLRAEAALPVIAKVLRTLKHTEDATPTPATAQLHALCDMALGLAQVHTAQLAVSFWLRTYV